MGPDKLAVIPGRFCSREFANTLRAHKPGLLALLNQPETTRIAFVKPDRPLTERELWLLRRAGAEKDSLIITAINLFSAMVVE
jgi:hypothetical protein